MVKAKILFKLAVSIVKVRLTSTLMKRSVLLQTQKDAVCHDRITWYDNGICTKHRFPTIGTEWHVTSHTELVIVLTYPGVWRNDRTSEAFLPANWSTAWVKGVLYFLRQFGGGTVPGDVWQVTYETAGSATISLWLPAL